MMTAISISQDYPRQQESPVRTRSRRMRSAERPVARPQLLEGAGFEDVAG